LDRFAVFKPRQVARDNFPGGPQTGNPLPHRREGYPGFFGDLQIQSLAMLFQVLKNLSQDSTSEKD
jgi:hypothetical protein